MSFENLPFYKFPRIKGLFVALVFFLCSCSNSINIEKALYSVITIKTSNLPLSSNYRNSTIGSGVIISKDGVAVTNYHVIKNHLKEIFAETSEGITFPARVLGVDDRLDLAVLKIESEKEFVPAIIGDTSLIKLGDEIYAAGNPYGLGVTLSKGIISATGRDYGNPYLELIQTDAAINPGNSGGALINENGNLIGINTKIFSRTGAYQGLGFAIPSNNIVQIASEIIQYGEIRSGWIGNFRVAPIRLRLNNNLINGLRIVEIDSVGPLYEKGASVNDVIIRINNNEGSWKNLTSSLKFAGLGNNISFEIISSNNTFKSIEIESSEIKELTR